MKTQSIDTSPETERQLVELLRKAPVSKRFYLVQSLTHDVLWSQIHTWQERHRNVSEQEAAIHVVSSVYGKAYSSFVERAITQCQDWHIQPVALLTTMLPLMRVFQELDIACYLGGSIASSLHGMQQLANDIDLVVALDKYMLPVLSRLSRLDYIFDENDIQRAFYEQTSFSLFHLHSLIKIDVIIPGQSRFNTGMRSLITPQVFDKRYPPILIASATEMILFKLQRFHQRDVSRKDGMHDDAEWNDILGMLKVQGPELALDYLESWARTFGIMEAWQQALVDAGLRES